MPPIYHYTLFRVNIFTICLYYAGNIWLIYLLQAIYGQYTDRFITIVPNILLFESYAAGTVKNLLAYLYCCG